MRKLWLILLLIPTLVLAQTPDAVGEEGESPAAEEFDMTQFIFGHIADAYEWHITTIGEKEIAIPLPCILIEDGIHVFTLHHAEEHGYKLNEDGKLVNALTGERPVDISITKNVVGLMVAAILLVVLILSCARWYRTHDVLKEKPTGLAALLEPVIVMIEQDVIKDAVGPEYKRFSPYLLTAFFFILINNLLGIIPFFPFGANVTGNIAVTCALALFTFFMVNIFGSRHYWKEVLWPDVPIFLKAIPIMPVIEILGLKISEHLLNFEVCSSVLGTFKRSDGSCS